MRISESTQDTSGEDQRPLDSRRGAQSVRILQARLVEEARRARRQLSGRPDDIRATTRKS